MRAKRPREQGIAQRILIVDDEASNRKLLGTYFEKEGFVVTSTASVEAATKVLAEPNAHVDLVLSDIIMPGQTGFDLLKWIKSARPDFAELPVLLITSQLPEPENRIYGLSLGAVDYVPRSIDPKELIVRARHAIDHYHQLKNLRRSLEDTENVAMVGRALAAANHEIKNLTNIIKITADQVLTGRATGRSENDQQRALEGLARAAGLLADISRGFGDFLGDQGIATKPVELNALIAETVAMVKPRAGSCLIEMPSSGLEVAAHASEPRLKQVLVNLLLNALESIEGVPPDEGGLVEIALEPRGERVLIHVRDNGGGLPSQEHRSTFEPFDSTKKLRGGAGLGLWLCARLIAGMGGELSLSSSGPGRGATASIALPRADTDLEADSRDEIDLSAYFEY